MHCMTTCRYYGALVGLGDEDRYGGEGREFVEDESRGLAEEVAAGAFEEAVVLHGEVESERDEADGGEGEGYGLDFQDRFARFQNGRAQRFADVLQKGVISGAARDHRDDEDEEGSEHRSDAVFAKRG